MPDRNSPRRPADPSSRRLNTRVLIIVAAIVVVLLALFLLFDFTDTATNVDSGGPDPEWQADPQPIPQLPPEGQSLDEPATTE